VEEKMKSAEDSIFKKKDQDYKDKNIVLVFFFEQKKG